MTGVVVHKPIFFLNYSTLLHWWVPKKNLTSTKLSKAPINYCNMQEKHYYFINNPLHIYKKFSKKKKSHIIGGHCSTACYDLQNHTFTQLLQKRALV